MHEPRTSLDPDAARRRQLGKRVKRGLVASYIHGLSARHREASATDRPAGEPLAEPARAA